LVRFQNSPPRRDFLINLVLVFVGGILGSLVRYVFSEVINNEYIAVLVSNVVGVFVAAVVSKSIRFTSQQKLLWITGFAGGLTTFSSLAVLTLDATILDGVLYLFITCAATVVSLTLVRKLVKI
jgi:fluoride ion exporter CrcB/FEX